MRKFISTILAGIMIVALSGCALRKNKAPESAQITVDRSVLGAADVLNLVATGVSAADDVRKQLASTNQITAAQSADFLEYLQVVAQKNEAAKAVLLVAEQGNQQADYKSAILAVAQSISSLDPALFGIKNANSQATLQSGLAVLQSAVQVIAASYGGK
jgi:hypothetical protein